MNPTLQAALGMIPSGRYLPENAFAGALRILVVAVDHDPADLEELAEYLLTLQLHHPYLKPIFLITALEAAPLSSAGFLYETAMTPEMWQRAGFVADHEEYIDERMAEMADTYRVHRTVQVVPGGPIPRWVLDR